MIQILIGAEEVQRHEYNNCAWTWKGGTVLIELAPKDFENWVKEHIRELDATCVAFTGSASNLVTANEMLGYYLKEAELI